MKLKAGCTLHSCQWLLLWN